MRINRRQCEIRSLMPYGLWLTTNGETLFNRAYRPILERGFGDARARPADPVRRVPGIILEAWLFNDGNPPWRFRQTLAKCLDVFEMFYEGEDLGQVRWDRVVARPAPNLELHARALLLLRSVAGVADVESLLTVMRDEAMPTALRVDCAGAVLEIAWGPVGDDRPWLVAA